MWFIQALRIVFHENVPEEVLEMSCSWFVDFLGRLSSFKSAYCSLRNEMGRNEMEILF